MAIAIASLIVALSGIVLYRWLPGWLAWAPELSDEEKRLHLMDASASGMTRGKLEAVTLEGRMMAFITIVVLFAALFVILFGTLRRWYAEVGFTRLYRR